ncbi:unnamed protein product [Ectocarpus sp. CCAP 1310/34]|nr:unnamed protein product [Ectocarpus sp. CCAP 1310/34]
MKSVEDSWKATAATAAARDGYHTDGCAIGGCFPLPLPRGLPSCDADGARGGGV